MAARSSVFERRLSSGSFWPIEDINMVDMHASAIRKLADLVASCYASLGDLVDDGISPPHEVQNRLYEAAFTYDIPLLRELLDDAEGD